MLGHCSINYYDLGLVIPDPIAIQCGNGGTFNEFTEVCDCLPQYTGELCELGKLINIKNTVMII